MLVTPPMERFILHWGEMGTRWSVNRSVAQVHALLYLAPEPLTAEDISETLGLARSNVSTSLKELQNLGLVTLTHRLRDRRDHFETPTDPWLMLLTIAEARKQREIDPTLAMLRQCATDVETDATTPAEVKARIQHLLGFMETLTGWYGQIRNLPRSTLLGLIKMGARIGRLVGS